MASFDVHKDILLPEKITVRYIRKKLHANTNFCPRFLINELLKELIHFSVLYGIFSVPFQTMRHEPLDLDGVF